MQICLKHRKFSRLSRTGNGNIIQFVCYGTISVLLSSCTLGAIWRAPKRREVSTLWEGRAWMLQTRAIILKSPFHVALYSEYTSELTFKNATQALQNATTALSDAATAAENALMTTEDEEKNSSTSPSSRMPAPDQAPLEKDLPSTQPHPANPKSEDENAVIRTEDEDANKQKEHSSTSPSSRMPAPDQATLQKTLPSTQPQPANPRSEVIQTS